MFAMQRLVWGIVTDGAAGASGSPATDRVVCRLYLCTYKYIHIYILIWGIVTDERLHEAGTPPAALSRDRERAAGASGSPCHD